MDGSNKQTRPKNPKENASVFSVATFLYTLPTFWMGFKKELEESDIYETLSDQQCYQLGEKVEKKWLKELETCKNIDKKPSLWKVIVKTYGAKYAIVGIIMSIVEIPIKIFQVLSLGELITFFMITDIDRNETDAYISAAKLITSSLLTVMIQTPMTTSGYLLGIKIRSTCSFLVYRKSLRLSSTALGKTTSGQIMNILSNDIKNFERVCVIGHYVWIGPLQSAVLSYFIYQEVGYSGIFGLLFLLLFIPLHFIFGKVMSVYRTRSAARTDERIRLMNEIILGIPIIKMYTWEKPFSNLVYTYRRLEMKAIKVATHIKGLNSVLTILNARVAVFVTLVTYVLVHNNLNARQVFITTGFYNLVRHTMVVFFPDSINLVAEMNVCMKRLTHFLLLEETRQQPSRTLTERDSAIVIENASAKWIKTTTGNTLSDINLNIKCNSLIGVIGSVGSGKTSLLCSILNELPLTKGTINVQGKISYASQEPWLFRESIQENILFGSKLEAQRYNEVVKACALETDFQMLPYSDKTLVGERGSSLSGGQRSRANLARAIYRKADIYLLDDPLSAVDTHVGKEIFNNCIKGYLKKKTVVLVTHQLQYLKEVDHIVILDNGVVMAQGTPDELQKTGVDFAKFINEDSIRVDENFDMLPSQKILEITKDPSAAPKKEQELKTSGALSSSTYLSYIKSGAGCGFALVLITLFILVQVFTSVVDYFLAHWVNLEQSKSGRLENIRIVYLLTYTILIVVLIVLSLGRSVAFTNLCTKASIKLHDQMFKSIVRATIRFFDLNPSGRIINRFSKDMGLIDESLPVCMIDTLTIGSLAIGVILVVSIVNYWLIIPAVVISIIFYILRKFYMPTSRNIKRLDGITRSPVIAHLNSSLQGLTTIRAFGAQTILEKEFSNHQDLNTSVACLFLCTSKTFGYWLDVVCVLYITMVTVSCLFIVDENASGNVGLIISQCISLTGLVQWGMRQLTETENQMTAVERVLEYNDIEHEPPFENPEHVPKESWPEHGKIEFVDLSLRYFLKEPPVLKNLNLVMKPLEKVGIVGRTGAGKSSLISAIFRLADIEGSILIDDVDIKTMGLHDLRSKISIIPQDPVLFTGSMRRNLDPFVEFTDDNIWRVLEDVELKDTITNLNSGLNLEISEGGSNLSVGQRQLVCLARAMLRRNKILILDEATANVDSITDTLIQKTIRRNFANCTVLTIAHRLDTVMDSDKILVMDAGKVVEFDHPHLLLQNEKGVLYGMVYQTGSMTAQTLIDVAKNAYEKRGV